jgi:hypothetical protein
MLHCKEEHGQVHGALAGGIEVSQVVLHHSNQLLYVSDLGVAAQLKHKANIQDVRDVCEDAVHGTLHHSYQFLYIRDLGVAAQMKHTGTTQDVRDVCENVVTVPSTTAIRICTSVTSM